MYMQVSSWVSVENMGFTHKLAVKNSQNVDFLQNHTRPARELWKQ
jgi:hypothetical protein